MAYVTLNVDLDEVLSELSDNDLKTELEDRGYLVDADDYKEWVFTKEQRNYMKELLLKQDHFKDFDARECYEVLLNGKA